MNAKNHKEDKKKSIDQIDSKIICLLQKDGRISNTEIAKILKISEATVRLRIKKLIDEDIIQIVAVSNPLKLGFEITGDLYIHAEMKKIDAVVKELKQFKELWYIILTTGKTNINAEFIVQSIKDLNDLVYNKLSKIDGIKKIDISIITQFAKRSYNFGTAFDET